MQKCKNVSEKPDTRNEDFNDRGRLILEFLNFFNLKGVNFHSVCTGPLILSSVLMGDFHQLLILLLFLEHYVSINSKRQHLPGNPRGFAKHPIPAGRIW